MKHFYALFLLLLTAAVPVLGQPTHSFDGSPDAPFGDSFVRSCRHLMLDVDAAGFFYDAEYATPFSKGYTVTGFRLSPALAYGINERALLSVGFNATAFAGLDSLYRLRPTFTLVYAPAGWLTLVAGTIYGSLNHRLDAPAYDPSRWIYNYQEDGLQILTNTRGWSSDTWLDWSHYLTPWTADQERFTMGTRYNFNILNIVKRKEWHDSAKPISGPCIFTNHHSEKNFKVEIPTHFIASHRGGEVKTIDTNTVTTFNERTGLRFNYSRNLDDRLKHSFTLDLPVYFYHLEDNTLDGGGRAFYPTLSYTYVRDNPDNRSATSLCAALGYWHGDHYFSAYGSPQFWSANAYSTLHMPASAALADAADIRNMLTFGLALGHEFKGLDLGLKADAYYDLNLRKTDFLIGFYMRFRERFILL